MGEEALMLFLAAEARTPKAVEARTMVVTVVVAVAVIRVVAVVVDIPAVVAVI